jgi:hypothetical protein
MVVFMELAHGRGAAKMPSLRTFMAGAAIPAGVVVVGHVAMIVAASITGLLTLLVVVLALVGVFAPDVTTKTDAVRVLCILLNRENVGSDREHPSSRARAGRTGSEPRA